MGGGDKTIVQSETRLGSLNVQNSSQGLPVPIVFGTTRISPNLLWYGAFTAIPTTETTDMGGKGGGSTTQESTTYTYTCGVIFGLMEGPSVAGTSFIGDVWKGKEVTAADALGLSQFSGSYTQTAWSYLSSAHPDEAINRRGMAYAAQSALDLGATNGLPNFSFEVTGLGGSGDVNLADILEPLLLSTDYGVSWPAAQLDDLADFRLYCDQAGFAAAPAYTAQRPAAEIIAELCRMGNAAPVWSGGKLRVVPYADEAVGTYTPTLTVRYHLTYDDFLAESGEPPIRATRKRQADAFNIVPLTCKDRANQYNKITVEAPDQWNIEVYGARRMDPVEALAICDPAVGRRVAQAILQRELYVRNTYEFTVGWRYARLDPMDIVSLTDPLLGLDQTPVRIVSIEEDDAGELHITAEDLNIGAATPGSYATQAPGGSTPTGSADPGDTYAPVIIQPPLAMTGGSPQIWIGAQGGEEWGGAQVWVSIDGGTSYSRSGTIAGPARYGTLTATLADGPDPDTSGSLQVDLTASRGRLSDATSAAADALSTLAWVDGEVIAYSAATLTSAYHYTLDTYLRRAQGGTDSTAHSSGTTFLRLDDAVARFPITSDLYGTTIQIKLLSYNRTGGGLQALADVTPVSYTVQAMAATGVGGYAWVADRASNAVSDPGAGKLRWNTANSATTTKLVFDALTADGADMTGYFSALGGTGFVDLRDSADTARWATYEVTAANAQTGYHVLDVVHRAGGAEIQHGRTVLAAFSPRAASSAPAVGAAMATWVNAANAIATPAVDVVWYAPAACNISGVSVLTQGGNGSCQIDIRKAPIAAYPPVAGNSICAANLPQITAGATYVDTTLGGWTKTIDEGDVLLFHLVSSSTFTAITLKLQLT